MPVCYVSEYPGGAPFGSQAVPEPALAEHNLAIGAVSVQSQAFSGGTRIIRVNVDVACCIAFGPNPIAVNTAKRRCANQTEFFVVEPGHRLAVIAAQ
jgi:hypothetical protein